MLYDVGRLAYYNSFAQKLIDTNGLRGWKFQYDRAVTRCGSCRFDKKLITLSRHFVGDQTVEHEKIVDVIIHECAHAVVGPSVGHGPAWRSKAIDMGGTGARMIEYSPMILGRIVAFCRCGHVDLFRHRMSKKLEKMECPRCGPITIIGHATVMIAAV